MKKVQFHADDTCKHTSICFFVTTRFAKSLTFFSFQIKQENVGNFAKGRSNQRPEKHSRHDGIRPADTHRHAEQIHQHVRPGNLHERSESQRKILQN